MLVSCGGNGRKQPSVADQAVITPTESPLRAPDKHTAETDPDYLGTYTGTLPAADCPGIRTTIVLTADSTYTLHMEYLERDVVFDEKGSFEVKGNLLTLTPDNGGRPGYCKVEENRLRQLDGNANPISGDLADHYLLRKN